MLDRLLSKRKLKRQPEEALLTSGVEVDRAGSDAGRARDIGDLGSPKSYIGKGV
jgi:hypothetical protein